MAPNTWAVSVSTAGLVLILAALWWDSVESETEGFQVLLTVGLVLLLLGLLFFGVVDSGPDSG